MVLTKVIYDEVIGSRVVLPLHLHSSRLGTVYISNLFYIWKQGRLTTLSSLKQECRIGSDRTIPTQRAEREYR